MSEQKGAQKSIRKTKDSALKDEQLDEIYGGIGSNSEDSSDKTQDEQQVVQGLEELGKQILDSDSVVTNCWPSLKPQADQFKP